MRWTAFAWCVCVCVVWGGVAWSADVYVEDSPAAVELAERAEALREQGRLSEAVATYQQVSSAFAGKLMPTRGESGEGVWRDTLWWVRDRIASDPLLMAVFIKEAEPTAAGLLTSAQRGRDYRDWDRSAINDVFERYWLTPSGLSAGLDLAAFALMDGELATASGVLNELETHPGLTGSDADGARSRPRFDALRHAVTRLQAELNTGPTPTAGRGGDGEREASAGAGVELEQAMWTRLWGGMEPRGGESDEDGVELRGRWDNLRVGMGGGGGVTPVVAVPTLSGDRVLTNEGSRVLSLDRVSGRLVWSYEHSEGLEGLDPRQARAVLRMSRWLPERRGVLVLGDRLIAVMGRGSQQMGRFGGGALFETRLVCLSASDGGFVWSVGLGEPAGGLERAHLSGTPVRGGGGLVLVSARRVEQTGFVSSMVLAFRESDGKLVWRRHLASTSVTMGGGMMGGAGGVGGVAGVLVEGSVAYVSDGLGAAACLDVASGGVRWLRRLGVQQAAAGEGGAVMNGNIGGGVMVGGGATDHWAGAVTPVMLSGGLVVASHDRKGAAALVLSPRDGALLRTLGNADLGEASDLRAVGGDLLVLGRRVSRLDGATLKPRWSVRADRLAEETVGGGGGAVAVVPGQAAVRRPSAVQEVTASGVAGLGEGFVVVPMRGAWLTLSLADGSVLGSAGGASGANLVVSGPEVFAATDTGVSFFASWDHAYALLTRRIAVEPSEPDAGLGLAFLSARTDRATQLLEGIDAVVRAVGRRDAAQDGPADEPGNEPGSAGSPVVQVIELLLSTPTVTPAVAASGLDRVATALHGPREVASYHLARGRVEELLGHPTDAVGHYQAVLTDTALAEQYVAAPAIPTAASNTPAQPTTSALRAAGLQARQRLAQLIADHGPMIYEPFQQHAARELEQLLTTDAPADLLLALAERYPLAAAAASAQLEAGQRLAQGPRPASAVGPFRRAYQTTADPALRARSIAGLASLYVQLNQPGRAARWLKRVAKDHPTLTLEREGQPITPADWLALLGTQPDQADAPVVLRPPLAAGTPLPGMLLPHADDAHPTQRSDRFVLRHRQQLQVIDLDTLSPRATLPDPGDDAQLLRFHDEQLLVWSPGKANVWAYNSDTGQPAWPPLDLRATLNQVAPLEALEERRSTRESRALVRMFEPGMVVRDGQVVPAAAARPEPLFVVANDDLVLAVDGVGRAVAFDRHTGQPLWQTLCPVESVSGLWLGDDTAVVRGLVAVGTDAQAGAVAAIDLVTGDPRSHAIEERLEPLHAQLLSVGLLAVVYPQSVAAFDPDAGQLVWRVELSPTNPAQPNNTPTFAGTLPNDDQLLTLVTLDNPAQLLLLDPRTGKQRAQRFEPVAIASPMPVQRRVLLDRAALYAGSPTAVSLDADGNTRWRSAVRDPRVNILHQHLTQDHLAVLVLDARSTQNNTLARRLQLFHRNTGRLESDTPLPMSNAGSLDRILPLDNAVAITIQQTTYVLRGQ